MLTNGTIVFVNNGTAASNSEVADLWLALRGGGGGGGGGGNFGVVVELQMKLHATRQVKPDGTSITGTGLAGQMCWSLTRSEENATNTMAFPRRHVSRALFSQIHSRRDLDPAFSLLR